MTSYEFTVTNKTGISKLVIIHEEDVLKRYGKLTTPTKMFVKDFACSKGIFPWAEYTELTTKRLLY